MGFRSAAKCPLTPAKFLVKLRLLDKVQMLVYRARNISPSGKGIRSGAEFIGVLTDPGEVDLDAIVSALSTAK
jgi:hypothetical protein